MKKPVEFASEAQEEYLAALTWYWERSPATASRFEAEVEAAVETIQRAPTRWARYTRLEKASAWRSSSNASDEANASSS